MTDQRGIKGVSGPLRNRSFTRYVVQLIELLSASLIDDPTSLDGAWQWPSWMSAISSIARIRGLSSNGTEMYAKGVDRYLPETEFPSLRT